MTISSHECGCRSSRSGLTLIELCVVIGIVGLLAALVIPAVLTARESGRRAQCAGNLRQLALALHSYHDVQNCLPSGTPLANYAVAGTYAGHSVFIASLAYFDQQSLYDAVNFDFNIYLRTNRTVRGTSLGVLHCPSDPSVEGITTLEGEYLDTPAGEFVVADTSYGICAGTWYHYTENLDELKTLCVQDNGMAFVNSAIRFSEVSDGLSQTLLLAERAHGALDEQTQRAFHWWSDGYFGDTLFWTLYPPNAYRLGIAQTDFSHESSPATTAAGSLHSAGAHFAFCDGSVRYLKDSIDSWPIDIRQGMPIGVRGGVAAPYRLERGVRPGLYQMLSTRNGAETFSSLD